MKIVVCSVDYNADLFPLNHFENYSNKWTQYGKKRLLTYFCIGDCDKLFPNFTIKKNTLIKLFKIIRYCRINISNSVILLNVKQIIYNVKCTFIMMNLQQNIC